MSNISIEQAFENIKSVVRNTNGTAEYHEFLNECLKLLSEAIKK